MYAKHRAACAAPLQLPGGLLRAAWITVAVCAASLSLAHGIKLLAFACRWIANRYVSNRAFRNNGVN